MCIRVHWENNAKSVMTITLEGRWSLSELKKGLQAALFMQNTVPHPVEVIYNLTASAPLTDNCTDIMKRLIHRCTSSNTRRIIFVSQQSILHLFLDMLDHSPPFANRHYTIDFVDSIEDARAMVALQRLA
jgi:hypothetical protein